MQNKKIIEYRTVGGDVYWLNPKINELIKDGWQPYGPVTAILSMNHETDKLNNAEACQVMVKYEAD